MTTSQTPTLDALDAARGDIDGVRRALVEGKGEEEATLEDELGDVTHHYGDPTSEARRAVAVGGD